MKNGWSGFIVNGCIRDSEAINNMDFGVKAIGCHPRKTEKVNRGDVNTAVSFGGREFQPGSYVVADADGIVVLDKEQYEKVGGTLRSKL